MDDDPGSKTYHRIYVVLESTSLFGITSRISVLNYQAGGVFNA